MSVRGTEPLQGSAGSLQASSGGLGQRDTASIDLTDAERARRATIAEPSCQIELKIREIGQLFQSLDPLPFRERDLDAAVEEYVVAWAREQAETGPIRIVIHLPDTQARREEATHIGDAIRNYFAYRAQASGWELSELFRVGRSSLVIGLVVLAVCVVLGAEVSSRFGNGYSNRFFGEGLIILGWVANWRPIQIFLYDWWPLARQRSLYNRLAQSEVQLRPDLC